MAAVTAEGTFSTSPQKIGEDVSPGRGQCWSRAPKWWLGPSLQRIGRIELLASHHSGFRKRAAKVRTEPATRPVLQGASDVQPGQLQA
jgi:hypothetical protein